MYYKTGRSQSPFAVIPVVFVLIVFLLELSAFEFLFAYRLLYAIVGKIYLSITLGSFGFFLWVLSVWSYLKCVLTDAGRIPENFQEFTTEKGLSVAGTSDQRLGYTPGQLQFCSKCAQKRPERAHHCDICGGCILRMDHHCGFIGNCVGFGNMKYFLLWDFWTAILSLFLFCASTPYMTHILSSAMPLSSLDSLFQGEPTAVPVLSESSSLSGDTLLKYRAVSQLFAIAWVTYPAIFVSMTLFFGMNIGNVLSNVTEIEVRYRGKFNPYDIGPRANVEQVFGQFDLSWFLPIPPWKMSCDGLSFPLSTQKEGFVPEIKAKEKCSKEDFDEDKQSLLSPLLSPEPIATTGGTLP